MPPEIFMGRQVIRVAPPIVHVLRLGYRLENQTAWVDINLNTENGIFTCPQFPCGPQETLRDIINIVGEFLDSREE